MKPEAQPLEARDEADDALDEADAALAPVAGDVIGDTAYSERFVLKLLLKLANLDTLADEQKQKTFEDDLCILWDMAAEQDVVKFLQQHKILNLISFALPVIDSPRILEIVIGIIGNMCCLKDATDEVVKMRTFLRSLLEYIESADSLLLIQVLQLVNSCLYQTNQDDLATWLEIFETVNYPRSLNFILKSSSNQEVLINAIENFNTIFCYCNNDKFRATFSTHFVTAETTEALFTAFTELTEREYDNERILLVMLQIMVNLLQFKKSEETYPCKEPLVKLIQSVMNYYRKKIVEDNDLEVDTDLDAAADCTMTLVKVLDLSESCDPDMFFDQTYNIWKSLTGKTENSKTDHDSVSSEILETIKKLEGPLCDLMFLYMEKCTIDNLLIVLNKIGLNYGELHQRVTDNVIKMKVSKRTENHRSRLLDNVST